MTYVPPSTSPTGQRYPEITEELEWWKTWRAALIACSNKIPRGAENIAQLAQDVAAGRDGNGKPIFHAMQCATLIAAAAHGFTPETYAGPR